MSELLQLTLLGKLQINHNGQPVTGFISSKAQALFCYLAVTGRPHFRQSLLGLFWADMPEAEAKANLRVTLSNLRRLLGPYLLIDRESVAFNGALPYRLDVAEFEAKLRPVGSRPDLELAQEAVALYQGDFLEGFYVREAPVFEEWVLLQRERLRELALQALHSLAVQSALRGDYTAGIDYNTRLLALDPWREEAHRQLMLLLARNGQRRAALAQYESCRRILAQEMGVIPMAETTALYERLMLIDRSSRHNLPPQPTPFIGRTAELEELTGLLSDPACRLVTVVGAGGAGKTRLAIQAAAQTVDRFLEGVCFVSLAALSSAQFLATALAQALKLPAAGSPKELESQLMGYLQAKEMLLVLDNFEHLLPATGLLMSLLENAPDIKILVTSRERLNLRWEWVFDLEGLSFPSAMPAAVAEIDAYEAVQLFLTSARRVQRQFVLSPETAPCIVRICQLVDGMPLGLELAAASLRRWPCDQIAGVIEANLDELAASFQDAPERHRSLRAVFEHSWQLLPAEEQACFRHLSVFRGGFEEAAAVEVAGASPALLLTLAEKSLLRRPGPQRYGRHVLLWQYAYEKLKQHPAELETSCNRHCDYYTRLLRQKEADLQGEAQKAALDQIGAEIENIRLAWCWALEQDKLAQLGQSVESLYLFHDIRGWFQEGIDLFDQAVTYLKHKESGLPLEASSPETRLLLGRLLARQGGLCHRLTRYEEAKEKLQQSICIFQSLPAPADLAFAIAHLGYIARLQGDYIEARRLLEESLALYRRLDRPQELAFPLMNLGLVIHYMGHFEAAGKHLRESLDIYRQTQHQKGLATCLHCLGAVAREAGQYQEARQFYGECLEIGQKIGDKYLTAYALNHLSGVAEFLQEYGEASRLLQESLAIARELGDRRGMAYCLYDMGTLAFAQGRVQETLQFQQESLVIFEEINDRWGITLCLGNLGEAAFVTGNRPAASRYFDRGLKLALEIQAIPAALEILVRMLALLSAQGQKEQALAVALLVREHPASENYAQNRAHQFLAQLKPCLEPETTPHPQAARPKPTVETVIARVLEALPPKAPLYDPNVGQLAKLSQAS